MTQTALMGMELETLLAEIDGATERLVNAAVVDQKKEFVSNVYPLLRLLTESAGHRFADLFSRMNLLEEVIGDFLTGSESMILPELAARIQATFAIGLKLCEEVDAAHRSAVRSDPEHPATDRSATQIAVLIEAYRASAQIAVTEVAEVTAEEIDEDDEDDQPVNGEDKEVGHA